MAGILSISEFGALLRRSLPPLTNIISIAHSGGPDSTCLLYLLYAWLKTQTIPPFRLLSLVVDHRLQSTSALVAKQASEYALSLGVPSYTLTIPWSVPPYPRRPSKEEAFETVARQARYDILQSEMKRHKSSVLAMGHHADDNVETLLMRLNNRAALSSENNTLSKLKPIRSCRRFGMSNADKLLGMHQWIVRPFLSIPKSRILATCEHYKIPYTIDQSNFQPSITPRNFVRQCLQVRVGTAMQSASIHRLAQSTFTTDSVDKSISMLESIADKHIPSSCTYPLLARLYSAAQNASNYYDEMDNQVAAFLSASARPSPLSTFIIPSFPKPVDASVRDHFVRRVLRYVSPYPWGHPSAEASGSSANLTEISRLIWMTDIPHEERRTFTLGSQVVWRPSIEKKIPYWIASRQPPIRKNNSVNPCIADITHLIKTQEGGFQYIWDNRFLVIIRPALAPAHIQALFKSHTDAQVVIVPYTNWFLPKIEFRYNSESSREFIILAQCSYGPVPPFCFQLDKSPYNSQWIQIEYMRVLDSI